MILKFQGNYYSTDSTKDMADLQEILASFDERIQAKSKLAALFQPLHASTD